MIEGVIPIEIFCCYAHEDEVWLQKLETHLSLLKRQEAISLWHDRLIVPGTDWAKAIDTHLETASVILLLLSADFFASDYRYGIEMQRALERQQAGEALVIPILLRPVDWKGAPFAHLQALPTDARPIVSWQDEDSALADVAAGIRHAIEGLQKLPASAPRATLPAIWNIPYSRNPFFLGRTTELAQLHHLLQTGRAAALSQPQAISGLGGIGKTQLALEYAYQYHQDYQAVFWARAEDTEALISSCVAIATLLHLPEREAEEQMIIVQAVKTWLQKHHGWLLILDNADDLTLLPDFLPPSLGGHLLLTTRAAAMGRLAHRVEIETLEPAQGALFLLRRAAFLEPDMDLSQATQEEQDMALLISQELGGLPLALDQAGAYLEETGIDLAGYWQIYQQHRADLLQERRGLVGDHPAPVATTWALSFRRVEERNPAAADLLCLCAFLSPDAIPEEILMAGASSLGPVLTPVAADPLQRNQALEALRAYSLMRRDPTKKTLSIHRLVQVVLQGAQEEAERRTWAKRAMLAVNAAFSHVEESTWSQCERLLPQALIATQIIEQYQIISEEAGRLLHETATYLLDRVRYAEAEPLYQRALHIREQALGPEHLDVAASLNGLADLCRRQGKFPEAVSLYQRALHIREQALGPEHLDVAYPLNGLADLCRRQGKFPEAVSLYQRALHIREQALGPEHPDVAASLNGLANLYCSQSKDTQAEPLYQRALHIREQVLGSEHPYVAVSLNGLANLYRDRGKLAEAEPLYQRALQIREQVLGSEHPDVAYSLNGLANLYRDRGKLTEAEPLYQQALHIREQALGPEHLETAETMHDLARLREAQGNSEEASVWYARALAISELAFGVHHPKTSEARTRLIALLHVMGHHEEAAQLETVQAEP